MAVTGKENCSISGCITDGTLGEIFYQLQHDEFTLTPNFQHFLSGDSADLQSTTLQLNSLRKARIETRKIIKSKIDNTEKLLQTLELQRSVLFSDHLLITIWE
jgi:hypothetical protein